MHALPPALISPSAHVKTLNVSIMVRSLPSLPLYSCTRTHDVTQSRAEQQQAWQVELGGPAKLEEQQGAPALET